MSHALKILTYVCAALLVVTALDAFAPDAAAQCAMCKTAIAAGGEKVARTMNAAMLVLLIPPVAIFCSIFAVVARRKNSDADEAAKGGV